MLFSECRETCSNAFPNKGALACQGQRLTLGSIEAHVNSLWSALINDGLRKQDRVAVYLDNFVHSVVSVFGALKAFMVSHYIESRRDLPRTFAW